MTNMNTEEDAAKRACHRWYRAYFSVMVCAANEKEAMIEGFNYLETFYGGHDNDDEERNDRRMDWAEVAFDHAEVIGDAASGVIDHADEGVTEASSDCVS